MKKRVLLLIVTLTLMSCMVACSGTASPKSPEGTDELLTLSVWTYYNGAPKDAFYSLVDEFNQTIGKENNIIVEPHTTGSVNDLSDAVIASANEDIGAAAMPHMFMAYSGSAYTLDQMGMVLDLDPYFTQEELDGYSADFLEDGRFGADDTLKIIPIAKSSEIIFLNKTDFDLFANEVHVDMNLFTTWEGLAKISAQYYHWTDAKTEAPNDGKAFFGMDRMANYMLVAAKQLDNAMFHITNDGAEVTLSRETAQTIWDNFYIPFVNGYYASIGNFRSDDAKTGDLLAYTGSTSSGSWFPKQVELGKDESYPIEAMTFPIPTFENGTPVAIQQGAGMVVAKSDEAHQNASILFLKWLTDAEQNSIFTLKTGYIPVKTELLTVESLHTASEDYFVDAQDAVVAMTANTAYAMLDTHYMYADKPFATSDETRVVLEDSLLNFAKHDLAAIQEAIQFDTKENVLSTYITDENFNTWYDLLIAELNETIAK